MSLTQQEKDLLLSLLTRALSDSTEETSVKEEAQETLPKKRGRKPKAPKEDVDNVKIEKDDSHKRENSRQAKFTKNKFVDDLSSFREDLKFNKSVDFKVSKREVRESPLINVTCERCNKKFLGLSGEFICGKCARQ